MMPTTPGSVRSNSRWMEKLFRGLIIAFCFAFIILDFFIIFSRLFYPYQLEWMEGAGLVQVSRLLAGKSLYNPPSIEYVPLIYPPLFFYTSAVAAKLIGLGFGPMRLVSFLSSATCAVVIYLAVSEKTNSKFAALLGAGCFASTFMLTGQWFDIARPDMLAAGFSMLAIYLARENSNVAPLRVTLSGFVLALAFLSKQSALIVCLAAVFYYILFNRRCAIWLTLSLAISLGVLYAVFWHNTAGWINYYLFTIPAAHKFEFNPGRIISVLIGQFAPVIAFLIAGLTPVVVSLRKLFRDKSYRYYIVIAGALIATGIVGRLNAYSGPNVYTPSYLGIALLVGLEAGWLIELAKQAKIHSSLILAEWVLLSAQFGFLIPAYFQSKTIPTQQDRAAGDALVARIKSYSGDVVLLDNNYLALYANKTPYFNEMAMAEVNGLGNLYPQPQWKDLEPQVEILTHAPTTDAVIVDFTLPVKPMITGCAEQPIRYADKTIFEPVAGPPNSRPSLIITCK